MEKNLGCVAARARKRRGFVLAFFIVVAISPNLSTYGFQCKGTVFSILSKARLHFSSLQT